MPHSHSPSLFRRAFNNVTSIVTQILALLARWIRSLFETGEITLDLESIGESPEQAKAKWRNDRASVVAMAERNQIKLEQALRLRDAAGDLVPPTKERYDFHVVIGKGYFPIVGNLLIPVGAGTFRGQGCYVRRKSLPSAFKGVTTHPTALCPIGGSDNNGILTQCGSSRVFDFAISGCLKDEGDGGNGMILGHTPPEPDTVGNAKPNVAQYWAGQPNRMPQKRFGEPQIWTSLTSFNLKNSQGQTEITVPAKGTYSAPKDVLLDDTVDIPLVRWVRAFDANGKEVARYANSGKKLDGKLVGINADDRQTTGRPRKNGETRVYNLPISETDKTTTVIVPLGLPVTTKTVDVSFYNLVTHHSLLSQMTPYLTENFYTNARASYNEFLNIVVEEMPWNGFVGIDGAYNTHIDLMARENGLDGWYFPGGYEDYMHNSFIGCAAVNNEGWGLYLSQPTLASRSGADNNQWPNAEGELVVHRKWTYIASSNDLGNFDGYGNRGGSLYMGASSNSMQTGSMEHHFDSHNIDPFGTSSTAPRADWNPMRWTSLVVFTADSRQNDIVITSTPTDSRRVTYCKARLEHESPSPSNPDSNIYSGLSGNHYCHPRPDTFGSLIDVRPPSIAHLHLTPYDEHERAGGDMQAKPGGPGELQGLFSGIRKVLFRPWVYEITPIKNHLPHGWNVVFSAKDKNLPGAGKDVTLSADALGLAGQHALTTLHFGSHPYNFKGFTIEAGQVKTLLFDIATLSEDFDNIDMNLLSVGVNYLFDELKKTPGSPSPKLPASLLLMPARVRLWKNAAGTKKFYVELPVFNTDSKSLSYPSTANQFHYFKIKVETAKIDNAI
ncbi:hypothetical protein LRP49_03280 [Enterovibrio sp. ZSDZ35]|uniref:Uncharacterized protein n=1 Tax=Enterovibrio qingdaonensis TaxID=2899818 RepID=A0ABT5QGW7_9GAMM|nr:hypothetical protein [Enterovibrio sp. ZSDZ35]MDD1780215.1 hypothetical protein [Enterovibrio sp. ZSDZ35]